VLWKERRGTQEGTQGTALCVASQHRGALPVLSPVLQQAVQGAAREDSLK